MARQNGLKPLLAFEERPLPHRTVDDAKRALGERGPVWWKDGSPDLNRHMAKNTVYARWFAKIFPPAR
uniref:hypothetical protein n=1 Tax=Bradyrhizobium sp. 195 TaxID=2782662 RepID=UPI00200158C9|nr:hypothetical protein [Bradyrhizobium sp. 195]